MMPTQSPDRAGAIERARQYVAGGAFEAELERRVAIPTESQVPRGLPHLSRYLTDEMQPAFEQIGFTCQIFDNPVSGCGPVLLATRLEPDARTTVLGYGHGDVIRGLEDQWTKGAGPWQTARDGDRIYGRGTADNKAQHTINMAAMRAVIEERGRLGFNAKIMIEMGEENGSRGVREIIEANKAAFAADVFIGSDGPRVRADRPTISLGSRGGQSFDLICKFHDGAHHSGNWGGALADPAVVLSHAIATVVSLTGEIRIADWRPPPMSAAVMAGLEDIELDGGAGAPDVDPNWGEPGLNPAQNVYAWNSFAVLAMHSGNPDRPVNAIAPEARARCQLRYIAGTSRDRILPALREHLDAHGFANVEIALPPPENSAGFEASRTEPDDPWARWVQDALKRTTNAPLAVIPQTGGSICNELFTGLLGIPAIWIPHSYPGCSQHAPDEHILLPLTRSAMELMTGLYWDLGETGPAG